MAEVTSPEVQKYSTLVKLQPENPEAHFRLGFAHEDAGNTAEAVKHYETAIKLQPRHAMSYLHRGFLFAKGGELSMALQEWAKAFEYDPYLHNKFSTPELKPVYKGKFDTAVQQLERPIVINPKDAFARYQLGTAYKYFQKPELALQSLKRALDINPDLWEAHYQCGEIFSQLGQNKLAITSFQRAIDGNSRYADSHYELGLIYEKENMSALALRHVERAIELDGEVSKFHFALGRIFMKQTKYKRAMKQYQRALDLDPTDARIHLRLAECCKQMYRPDLAIHCYEKAVELDPESSEAVYELGATALQLGDIDRAITGFRKALEINPQDAYAHYSLAQAYHRQKDYEAAATHYGESARLNPKDAFAAYNLGLMRDQLSQPEQAIDAYRKAVELKPHDAQYHLNLGRAYLNAKRPQEAASELKQAIKLNPNDLETNFFLADVHMNQGQFDEAVSLYRKVVDLNPQSVEARFRMAEAFQTLDMPDYAFEAFQETVRLDPRHYKALHGLGHIYLTARKKPSIAVDFFQQALDVEPSFSASMVSLGEAYMQLGQPDRALQFFERKLEENRENTVFISKYCLALADSGHGDKAAEEIRVALQLNPESVELRRTQAELLGKQGRIQDALDAWNAAVRLDENDAESLFGYAKALQAAGREDEAKANLQRVLSIQPAHQGARESLTALMPHDPNAVSAPMPVATPAPASSSLEPSGADPFDFLGQDAASEPEPAPVVDTPSEDPFAAAAPAETPAPVVSEDPFTTAASAPESTETPAEDPFAAAATEAPAEVAETPAEDPFAAAATEVPAEVAETPAEDPFAAAATEAPAEVAETPAEDPFAAAATEAPAEVAETPAEDPFAAAATEAPAEVAETPAEDPFAAAATEAPAEATEAPAEDPFAAAATEAPAEVAETPAEDPFAAAATEASAEVAETPAEDPFAAAATEAPAEVAETPAEDPFAAAATEVPTEVTEAPAEPTEAPAETASTITEEAPGSIQETEATSTDSSAEVAAATTPADSDFSAEEVLQQAILANVTGQPDEAQELFESILAKAPDYAPLYFHFGQFVRGKGESERSNELFKTGLEKATAQGNEELISQLNSELNLASEAEATPAAATEAEPAVEETAAAEEPEAPAASPDAETSAAGFEEQLAALEAEQSYEAAFSLWENSADKPLESGQRVVLALADSTASAGHHSDGIASLEKFLAHHDGNQDVVGKIVELEIGRADKLVGEKNFEEAISKLSGRLETQSDNQSLKESLLKTQREQRDHSLSENSESALSQARSLAAQNEEDKSVYLNSVEKKATDLLQTSPEQALALVDEEAAADDAVDGVADLAAKILLQEANQAKEAEDNEKAAKFAQLLLDRVPGHAEATALLESAAPAAAEWKTAEESGDLAAAASSIPDDAELEDDRHRIYAALVAKHKDASELSEALEASDKWLSKVSEDKHPEIRTLQNGILVAQLESAGPDEAAAVIGKLASADLNDDTKASALSAAVKAAERAIETDSLENAENCLEQAKALGESAELTVVVDSLSAKMSEKAIADGRFDDAVAKLEESSLADEVKNPLLASALAGLAAAAEQSEDKDKATELYTRVKELAPDHEAANAFLAAPAESAPGGEVVVLELPESPDEALALLKEKLGADANDSSALRAAYERFGTKANARKLIDLFRELQKKNSGNNDYLLSLARAYSHVGKDTLAVVQFRKLLSNDPKPEVYLDLTRAYRGLKKMADAAKTLEQALEAMPNHAGPKREQVIIHSLNEDHPAAEAAAKEGAQMSGISEDDKAWFEKAAEAAGAGNMLDDELLSIPSRY